MTEVKSGNLLADSQLKLGEISGLQGVNGWVKIFSETQPRENIFSYQPWLVYSGGAQLSMEVLHWRKQGKTLVAKLKGLESREQARALIGAVIALESSALPSLEKNQFYWHQLIGMEVVTEYPDLPADTTPILGKVVELIETGANDVLVVQSGSKEHLVPWVFGEFVISVDLDKNSIRVNWDPEF